MRGPIELCPIHSDGQTRPDTEPYQTRQDSRVGVVSGRRACDVNELLVVIMSALHAGLYLCVVNRTVRCRTLEPYARRQLAAFSLAAVKPVTDR